MAYLQAALITWLTNVTAIKNLIAARLYYLNAPEVVTYPYVVYQIISDPDTKTQIGKDGSSPTVQFKIVDTTATGAEAVDVAIRTSLENYSGTQTVKFYRIRSVGRVDAANLDNYYEINHDYKMEYER